MIAAPIESDVDGIPKGSHRVSLPRTELDWKFWRYGRPVPALHDQLDFGNLGEEFGQQQDFRLRELI